MRLATLLIASAAVLAGCATTNYQVWEGRAPQVLEGQGGTKDIVDGVELWNDGTPPRRFQVMGVVTVEATSHPISVSQARSAVAAEVKKAGGDAAIFIEGWGNQGGGNTVGLIGGRPMVFAQNTKTQNRWQVIKYLK